MQTRSVVAIIHSLNERQVRYLVVGGLAVVAHGYVRFTADMDLMLDPNTENLERAVTALEDLGYRPRAPVEFAQFADHRTRELWARDKNMTVFSVFSDRHRATEIDLFLEPPIDFRGAWERAVRKEIASGVEAVFCSLDDLIDMKQRTGRPQDEVDIQHLRNLRHPQDTDS